MNYSMRKKTTASKWFYGHDLYARFPDLDSTGMQIAIV